MIRKDDLMPDFTSRRSRFHYLTAINLLESMGVPLKNIYMKAVGVYENYRGEIHGQSPEPGTPVTADTQISLDIGWHSAVDYMPYQFFYGLQGIRDSGHEWEDNARSLMAPFDAAMIRYEAAMRFYALKYEFGIIDAAHLVRFMALFEYDLEGESFDIDEIMLMAAILPSLYQWSGNSEVVSGILGRLFGYRVTINENVRSSTPIPDPLRYRLGSKTGRLGRETILGRSFQECDSTYEVVVGGVPPADVSRLLPGGGTRRRIERMLSYCMPGDLDYRIRVEVDREKARGGAEGYLGYSSFIGAAGGGIS